jgi:DNA-binding winged helix-turn-helix (wHTH) protein
MKITHKRILTIVVGIMVTLLGLYLGFQAYDKEDKRLKNCLETAFDLAVDSEIDNKTKELPVTVFPGSGPDSIHSQITLYKENETVTLEKPDSINNLSFVEKLRNVQQTYLFKMNPIPPSVFDSLWRMELRKQDIAVQTAVLYTNNITKETGYSHTDTLFYTSAYPIEKRTLGVGHEITLQGFAKITPLAVIKQSTSQFVLLFTLWILTIGFLIFFLFHKRRTVYSRQSASQTTGVILDMDKLLLTYNGHNVQLTKDMIKCLKVLWDSPEHCASYEELISSLYGEQVTIAVGKDRLNQTIKRIRNKLDTIRGIEIQNIPHKGYQLHIRTRKGFFPFFGSTNMGR